MKVNAIFLLIALAFAVLAGYGFFVLSGNFVIVYFSAVSVFLTLSGALAVSFNQPGTANIRTLSIVCFFENLVLHVIFSFIQIFAVYIIISSISLLVYILFFYSIYRSIMQNKKES
jgi:hypothetical protein